MKRALWLAFGILCLSAGQLYAAPSGKYTRSCKSCKAEGARFCCQCKDGYGSWWKRCIDSRCKRASLIDGHLRCRDRLSGWPRGYYQRRCAGCQLQGDRFCCQCNDKRDGWSQSCVDKRCKRVLTLDGKLWCAARISGWPNGSYRYRSRKCTGCAIKGGQFCCTCQYSPVVGRPRSIRSCVPQSCKSASAKYGYLRCNQKPKSWPKGRYYRQCADCRREGDQFCCACQQQDGYIRRTCVSHTCPKISVVYGTLQCAKKPKSWPTGWFYRSCTQCRMKDGNFCCTCRDKKDGIFRTCLASQCKRGYLLNGHLRCRKKLKRWPTGSYRRHCAECQKKGDRFCCTCKDKDGLWHRSCGFSGCKSMYVVKGLLRCSRPMTNWPKGKYRYRCVGCMKEGDRFCCTCKGRYGWRRSCIDKRCKKATMLRGHLQCKSRLASWPKGSYASACRSCMLQKGRFCCDCKRKDDLGRIQFGRSCITPSCKRVGSNRQGLLTCSDARKAAN